MAKTRKILMGSLYSQVKSEEVEENRDIKKKNQIVVAPAKKSKIIIFLVIMIILIAAGIIAAVIFKDQILNFLSNL